MMRNGCTSLSKAFPIHQITGTTRRKDAKSIFPHTQTAVLPAFVCVWQSVSQSVGVDGGANWSQLHYSLLPIMHLSLAFTMNTRKRTSCRSSHLELPGMGYVCE